jgi:hypothetical protein
VLRVAGEEPADDPPFPADAQARLEHFHRLHPSWDEAFQLYPVLRSDALP